MAAYVLRVAAGQCFGDLIDFILEFFWRNEKTSVVARVRNRVSKTNVVASWCVLQNYGFKEHLFF
jgi:hypothetical protein